MILPEIKQNKRHHKQFFSDKMRQYLATSLVGIISNLLKRVTPEADGSYLPLPFNASRERLLTLEHGSFTLVRRFLHKLQCIQIKCIKLIKDSPTHIQVRILLTEIGGSPYHCMRYVSPNLNFYSYKNDKRLTLLYYIFDKISITFAIDDVCHHCPPYLCYHHCWNYAQLTCHVHLKFCGLCSTSQWLLTLY